jgi:hypothetical protein
MVGFETVCRFVGNYRYVIESFASVMRILGRKYSSVCFFYLVVEAVKSSPKAA